MDLPDERKPDNGLFVDAAEHRSVDSLLDRLHRQHQHETPPGRAALNEPGRGSDDRDIVYSNDDQFRSAPHQNSLELALSPRFVKLGTLSRRRRSVETRDALRQPFAIDRLQKVIDGVDFKRADGVMLEG